MALPFPSDEWVKALQVRLNSNPKYAEVAKNWEGDMFFQIDRPKASPTLLYLDLWHGQCRDAFLVPPEKSTLKAAFTLAAPLENFVKILQGQLDPMQAMVTGKIKVQGNMVMMMKNIPTVLEFVRVCTTIDSDFPDLRN